MNMWRYGILSIVLTATLGLSPCRAAHEHLLNGTDNSATAADPLPPPKSWEVRTEQFETVVNDVFYAERSQNDQIMPTAVKLSNAEGEFAYQIDRMIYPTLGNPNLYVRHLPSSDHEDALLVVLRLEKETLPPYERVGLDEIGHHWVALQERASHQFRFFLIPRPDRKKLCSETTGSLKLSKCPASHRLRPSRVLIHKEVDDDGQPIVPEAFRSRATLRFYFDREAMGGVPDGLYDLRFELIKDGVKDVHEFHYNAVRVFDRAPTHDTYHIINITDSQVAVHNDNLFRDITLRQSRAAVSFLKQMFTKQTTPLLTRAAFITFNGDLHNGGTPATLRPYDVAWNYNEEAVEIVKTLRELPLPIFLTPGNHDGYVSMGHAPRLFNRTLFFFGNRMKRVILDVHGEKLWQRLRLEEQRQILDHFELSEVEKEQFAWESLSPEKRRDIERREAINRFKSKAALPYWKQFKRRLKETKHQRGGRHLNLFTGKYVRRRSAYLDDNPARNWYRVPDEALNMVLYDGFYQWRRTYGPLYFSWAFGQNHFININSFDLRQHRRTGWGMYIVNYGGSVSEFQARWMKQEIALASALDRDILMLAHHDPRGGHNGHDYPFYFRQVEYKGMPQSILNYVKGEVINPKLCQAIPEWAKSYKKQLSCLHDGLQEWMRPDAEFDCLEHLLIPASEPALEYQRRCDRERMQSSSTEHPHYSGYVLLHRLTTSEHLRTLVLGHTHYSSLEVYQPKTKLVPNSVLLDHDSHQRWAAMAAQNPVRNASAGIKTDSNNKGIIEDNKGFLRLLFRAAGHDFENIMQDHELVIIRLVSVANQSNQIFGDHDLYGFSVFEFTQEAYDQEVYRSDVPQLNGLYLYGFDPATETFRPAGKGQKAGYVRVDRRRDLRHRRLQDIKIETREVPRKNQTNPIRRRTDYDYLKSIDYQDDWNVLNKRFQLKTEPERP